MPLTATLDGERVDAVLASDDEWLELKTVYKSRSLLMSCGLPAFPRTSNTGLRHFVHKAGIKCGTAECWSETPQHRAGKSLIAGAAAEAGWKVTVEHPADDKSWIADVLVEKDGRRIALEVQWSKQGAPEFAARQKRYELAGVECFWFIHRRNTASAMEAAVPHLVFEGDGLPLDVLAHEAFQTNERRRLSDITQLILEGGYLGRAQTRVIAATLDLVEMSCFACHRDSTIWRIGSVNVRTRCQKLASFERYSYGSSWPKERLESVLYEEACSLTNIDSPLAPLRMHYSKTTKSSYLAYGCAHCTRGFFGDYFISNNYDWDEVTIPVSTPIPLAESLLVDPHVCEDHGFGRCSQEPREHSGPVFGDDDDQDDELGGGISMREVLYKMTGVWR